MIGPMASAVVVHYRGGAQLERCLESCFAEGSITDVIVVDNEGGVHDRRVQVVEMPSNVGYGRAANAGLDRAVAGPVLVLNQDVVLHPGTVSQLLDVGSASDAWLVGPKLVDLQGTVNASGARFPWPFAPPPPTNNGSWRYVAWLPGAALLFMPGHTDLRFDERYFMYVEDEDLCARVWAAGGRVVRADDVTIVHEGGTATRQRWSDRSIARRVVAGRVRMVRSHRGTLSATRYALGQALRGPFRRR
jgi:N-acetylglucosaminyl-diphospho-decaprenol L-rhamnosyltransferase